MYDYLVRRIRAVDKKKFIFFEGVTWSVGASNSVGGPGFDIVPGGKDDPEEFRRSVFSYHYYCPLIQFANYSANYPVLTRIICNNVGHLTFLSFPILANDATDVLICQEYRS